MSPSNSDRDVTSMVSLRVFRMDARKTKDRCFMKSSAQARFFGAALVFAFILICIMILPIDRAFAQGASGGPTIFDVRRSLPLEPDEPVTKDFYINVGPESGLKKGVYINVVRAVPIHDPFKNQQQATLNVPVGKLLVLDVQRGITVARLQSELSDDERPTLEFEGVMIGDHVDLGSATMDVPKKPKSKAKRQTASVAPEASAAALTEEVAVKLTPVILPPEPPVPSPASRAAAAAAEASVAPTNAVAPLTAPAALVPQPKLARPAPTPSNGTTSSQNTELPQVPQTEETQLTKPSTSADTASDSSSDSSLDT